MFFRAKKAAILRLRQSMKKLRKNERKVSSRQYAAKRFMVRIFTYHILFAAYERWYMPIFYFRNFSALYVL